MPLKQNIQTETMFKVVFCVLFFISIFGKNVPFLGGSVHFHRWEWWWGGWGSMFFIYHRHHPHHHSHLWKCTLPPKNGTFFPNMEKKKQNTNYYFKHSFSRMFCLVTMVDVITLLSMFTHWLLLCKRIFDFTEKFLNWRSIRTRLAFFDEHSTSIRWHSMSFDAIRCHSTSFDAIRRRSTSFDAIRCHLTPFSTPLSTTPVDDAFRRRHCRRCHLSTTPFDDACRRHLLTTPLLTTPLLAPLRRRHFHCATPLPTPLLTTPFSATPGPLCDAAFDTIFWRHFLTPRRRQVRTGSSRLST